MQNKAISPKVYVDNFRITPTGIEAYCIIDQKDVDFHINQTDFEIWADQNDRYESWSEIYQGYEVMQKMLTAYIEFLYTSETHIL